VFGPSVWKDVQESATRNGLQVFANATAWFTSDIIVKWLQYNFPFNTEPVLLLLDEFTGHGTEKVAAVAKKLNVHIMTIPSGTTSKTQPADLSWNKPFKGYMRQQWTSKLIEDLKKNGENFRAVAPSRDNVMSWTKEAWNYLSKETIINGFVKAGMLENVSVSHSEQQPKETVTDSLIQALENLSAVDSFEDDAF
jgi:hypothetical protein